MKTKNLLALLSVFVSLLLLAACGGAAQPAAQPAEQPAEKPAASGFKAGLLSPGSVNDQGWNSIAYNALKTIEKDLGAEISYVELEQDPASFEKAFRDYADQGYQFVLGHGFEFQDAAITVSKDYPNSYFFISSSRVHEGNVTGLNTDSSQPFYVMGVIAAKMGKKAGLVGGIEIPPIKEAFQGFINGAHSVNPDFPVSVTYIGSFSDAAAAKEAALAMIKDGADVVVPDADVAGLGVFQAISESGGNILTFGAFGDYSDKAPNVLANYFAYYGNGVVRIAKEVKEGKFKPGQNVEFGLKDKDVMWIEYNEKAATPVPADVRKLVEETTQKIISGEINTMAEAK